MAYSVKDGDIVMVCWPNQTCAGKDGGAKWRPALVLETRKGEGVVDVCYGSSKSLCSSGHMATEIVLDEDEAFRAGLLHQTRFNLQTRKAFSIDRVRVIGNMLNAGKPALVRIIKAMNNCLHEETMARDLHQEALCG
jgi:hypothetical protein